MLVRRPPEVADVALFDLSGSPRAAAAFARHQQVEAFAEGVDPPEWAMIMPLPGPDNICLARDGRRIYVPDVRGLVQASNDALTRQGGPGPVDKDHELYSWWKGGGPVIAWAHEFQLRSDGVYARTEWLPEAQQLIRYKLFRYTSMVIAWKMANIVRDERWGFITEFDYEPTVIRGFGITNIPALEVRAMFSHQHKESSSMDPMKRILARFGLSADATPEQLEAAVNAQFTEASRTPSLDQFVPRADYDRVNAQLAAANKATKDAEEATAKAEREQLLAQALKDGKVIPATADFYRAGLELPGGVERFQKFLQTAPVIGGATKLAALEQPTVAGLTPDEVQSCKVMGIAPEEYLKTKQARGKR